MGTVNIDINMEKPCKKCGQMGALPSDLCLSCAGDAAFAKADAARKKEALKFTKIKVSTKDAGKNDTGKNRIHLEWKSPKGSDKDDHMLNSADKAAPSFHEALQALSQDVIEMCELPDDYRKRIIVKSVSLSHTDGIIGATITATMELEDSNSPLNLNAPHKFEEAISEPGDPKQILDPACSRRIHMLIIEAEQFVKGVRQQIDAFAEMSVS